MYLRSLLLISFLLLLACNLKQPKKVAHYIYFGRDRELIHNPDFLANEAISGAQLKYTWRELEPEHDLYNLDLIQDDYEFLEKNHKKLFIQIQDVSFDTNIINVPRYMVNNPEFNGGISYQYDFPDDSEPLIEGLVARRWDQRVAERFHSLLKVLGNRFDGKIAGINLPETAVGLIERDKTTPTGFTYENYCAAIKTNMMVIKHAFPKSVAAIYANFMPGNQPYLDEIFQHALDLKVAVGGPDILVYKPGQMRTVIH